VAVEDGIGRALGAQPVTGMVLKKEVGWGDLHHHPFNSTLFYFLLAALLLLLLFLFVICSCRVHVVAVTPQTLEAAQTLLENPPRHWATRRSG